MHYYELTPSDRAAARDMILFGLNQMEQEIARENDRAPIPFTMDDEEFLDALRESRWEIYTERYAGRVIRELRRLA